MAVAGVDEPTVAVLLRFGAHTEAYDNNGWTALMLAAHGGHDALVRLLVCVCVCVCVCVSVCLCVCL